MNEIIELKNKSDEELDQIIVGISSDRESLNARQLAYDVEMERRHCHFYIKYEDGQLSEPFDTLKEMTEFLKSTGVFNFTMIHPYHRYNGW